jgi:signal transduction histidine kinase/CheY-like chemotaxis protein
LQQKIMLGQAKASASEMENTFMRFENEVNGILYSNALPDLNPGVGDKDNEGLISLEMLFSNYQSLIENIYIYNHQNNVLNLSYNKKNNLLVDRYVTQKQNQLKDKIVITISDHHFLYTFPVYKNDLLYANMIFTIDPEGFFRSFFENQGHDEIFLHWIIDSAGLVIYSDLDEGFEFRDKDKISAGIGNEIPGFLLHSYKLEDGKRHLLSAFYPLSMFQRKMGIVFSMPERTIMRLIIKPLIFSGISSILLLLLFVLFILGKLGKSLAMKEKTRTELSSLQEIFNNLPVGIMVLDRNRHTRIINQTAKDMLLVKDDESIAGRNLMDRFMLYKDYYDSSGQESAFDSNQFVLYKHEGEEVAVFKKDLPFVLDNEEFILSAFVDVTPIEKARKYEAAANTAKSEFLAKMSHEIRTPMNGIIGMTEALDQENLNTEQKEYLQIVKRSADLLLNLIDDILDFSKIEAGKMQLEEIPFKLREEVKFAVDLFRPIIEEKDLKLSLKVSQDVPENIIGDPFRLRQVLSNLISNAVKFTHEGEIAVGIELEEEYNNNITLLFYVEDTGVGIPRGKIDNIFNSFTQAEESTSRKYGGTGLGTTISKQLVNLMHGEIWVESPSTLSTQPDFPGSKFSFTIEVYSNEKLIKHLSTEKIQHLYDLNVLVFTSNSLTKQRLIRFFNHQKIRYDIFEHSDPSIEEIKEKLAGKKEPYQVLLIFDEPSLNGMQVIRHLHEERLSDAYLIFIISSNHKPDNYILARRYGVDHYLLEPFEQVDLINCIYESFPNVERTSGEVVRHIRPNLSVLVAEDNEINIRVAQTIFSNLGFNIDIARNGNEVIEKVKTNCYDIVFMDLVMPDRDGIQATVEIRAQGYQMPIIAMTATASSKSKSKAISSGMNDYIVKPVKIDSIRNILLKWFA